MDIKRFCYEWLASILIVVRRMFLLILYPYKTMRHIAEERDYNQLVILFGLILLYFVGAEKISHATHQPIIQIAIVLFNYVATIVFVFIFGYLIGSKDHIRKMAFLFAYALVPTLFWFYINSFLFVLLPPPRSLTLLGKTFSIVFLTLSVSLLFWKVMLWYLAVRFSTKLKFYDIVFLAVLYVAAVVPYSFYMYHIGFFRIPFI